jgi:excisionase family DNA binding protein
MISDKTLQIARRTAEELRQRGEDEPAQAIEALVDAAQPDALPSLDLLTTTVAGDVLGVSGQTIKNWVRQGQLPGYRVGGRIMVPRDVLAEYVRRARRSLELDVISDEEAASLVEKGRRAR